MSKKTKAASKIKRQSFKRGRKEAVRKQYEQWAASGQNSRSKRSKLNSKRASHVRTKRHADGACGNVGCETCSGNMRPRMNDWRSWRAPMPMKRKLRSNESFHNGLKINNG